MAEVHTDAANKVTGATLATPDFHPLGRTPTIDAKRGASQPGCATSSFRESFRDRYIPPWAVPAVWPVVPA